MKTNAGLSGGARATVRVTGEEIRSSPHEWARSGHQESGTCPACQRVHESHLVRYLSVSGPSGPADGGRGAPAGSKYYPPEVVPVLSPREGSEGFLMGQWAVASA